jgi:hypothetical protein
MTHWHELIQGDPNRDAVEHFRVVSRRGTEFLVLPSQKTLAVEALNLYPAQTALARGARWGLRLLLKTGLYLGQKKLSLTVNRRDWLGAFFGQSPFAILCGNSAAKGRRFIFLSFKGGCPASVAKAGLGNDAAQLISREVAFLRTAAGIPGMPQILDEREHGSLRSFCMEFVPGASPKTNAQLSNILHAWVTPGKAPLNSIAQWKMAAELSGFDALKRAGNSEVSPVLSHGDFAPWNIREHEGEWTAIDWERGEMQGVPGWDWLHFEIQTAVLIHKSPAAKVFSELQCLFQSTTWTKYATRTGILEMPNELLIAYLIHAIVIVGQTEGVAVMRDILMYATEALHRP